jgi:hypothetical protein
MGDIKQPSKADVNRYKKILAEIRIDIDTIEHAVARLGKNLQQIRDRRLYFCGGYSTFKDLLRKRTREKPATGLSPDRGLRYHHHADGGRRL